ncbi:uncharacterized protein LOC129225114 [Uloborus diversus]|uniref:uncharacterized protein LOC129225114 n=1 Tax=Uloborus diversus TaxID=327109 RepID=UPI0024092219|nr:uncharacterized protein LOC129225114 [Uloborus diversus]
MRRLSKMWNYLYLCGVLFLGNHIVDTAVVDCDDVHLHCTNKDFHDSLETEPFSLLDEETLDTHCNDILDDLECKRSYLAQCHPEGFDSYTAITDGPKSVLKDLCNKSSTLRKEYHEYSPCLSNSTHLYENCIFQTIVDTGSDGHFDDEYNDYTQGASDVDIQRSCRLYLPLKNCLVRETIMNCNQETANFLDKIVVRAAKSFIQSKCQNIS